MKNNGYVLDSIRSIFNSFGHGISLKYVKYRIKWWLFPKLYIVSKFPTCLNIEITNACNLKCIMCYNNDVTVEKGIMDLKLYKKIIDEGSKHNLNSIKLSWRGEPLLNKNIVEMIKYAKEKNILEVSFNTNGLLLTEELSNQLIDSKLDMILFSVDGATKESYEKIRLGGDYNKMVHNIMQFLEIKRKKKAKLPYTRIQFVKMEENVNDVDLLLEKWEGLVDKVLIYPSLPYKFDADALKDFKILGRKPCEQLWKRLSITWDGKVSMCCIDWEPAVVLGNVNNDTIYSLWHGELLTKIRKFHKKKRLNNIIVCTDCSSLDSYITKDIKGG